jgi:glucose-1-phosphate cytidylyltransferase
MKVVLFCGGFGTRLREYSESIPKPMVPIGYRPILWHVMKYYAHYGHKDFILCLGFKADVVKRYFLEYDECASNDFVLSRGGRVDLLASDTHDWTITFVDTGTRAKIGERLLAVRPHLDGEETFLANYSDGLSDVHLPDLVDFHRKQDAVATFLTVKPSQSFHTVQVGPDGVVNRLEAVTETDTWINAGFFVLQHEVFDYLHEGEELVGEAFGRLIGERRLCAARYDGFFGCMDTFKEKQQLDDMHARGETPWEVWKRADRGAHPGNRAVPLDMEDTLSADIGKLARDVRTFAAP